MIRQVKRILGSNIYRKIRISPLGELCSPLFHTANRLITGIIYKIYGKRGFRLSIAGTFMYVDPSFIISQTIAEREPMLEKLLSLIEPHEVFIDVGAYVGTYSIPIAKAHNKSTRVIAIEPAPQSFALLKKHIEMNEVRENVQTLNVACCDSSRDADFDFKHSILFSERPLSSENYICVDDNAEERESLIKVKAISLDDYLKENEIKPNYMKIDVEGSELQVLRGAKETLRKVRPIVFCELHKFNWHMFDTSEQELLDLLSEVGYVMFDVKTEEVVEEIPHHCHVIMRPASGR